MDTPAIKHTNEALAFITLYKAMTSEIQQEVKDMIIIENEEENIDILTALSFEAWDMENNQLEQESAIWEKFYNEQKGV